MAKEPIIGIDLGTTNSVVATVIDAVVHQLQLHEVDCNRDDCASADSAHDGHGAGRCIRLGAASAVAYGWRITCNLKTGNYITGEITRATAVLQHWRRDVT